MLDIGWTELLVIGALALIVVGPRDLPQLLRTVGQTVGKIKRMAREFQRSMEDAARETDLANFKELRDLKKDMGSFDFRQQAAKAQSYMNQPVKPDAAKTAAAGAAETSGSAAAGPASADRDGQSSVAQPTETPPPAGGTPAQPPAAPSAGAEANAAAEPPRQAGAKG